MPRMKKLALVLTLLYYAPVAVAQSNLGELLDTGATRLSAEEFRQEVVGRIIVGPTATGGRLELMYATNGIVAGTVSLARAAFTLAPVSGDWKIDENGRICASMRIGGTGASASSVGQVSLPARCQSWFKYAGQYFLSDSDSDRSAKVFRRTLKQ